MTKENKKLRQHQPTIEEHKSLYYPKQPTRPKKYKKIVFEEETDSGPEKEKETYTLLEVEIEEEPEEEEEEKKAQNKKADYKSNTNSHNNKNYRKKERLPKQQG